VNENAGMMRNGGKLKVFNRVRDRSPRVFSPSLSLEKLNSAVNRCKEGKQLSYRLLGLRNRHVGNVIAVEVFTGEL